MMNNQYAPLSRIDALPLIEEVDAELESLLRGLQPEEWRLGAVKAWTVKDVAAHLLDGNLRRLSMDRDQWRSSAAPKGEGYREIVGFLNNLNADWIRAADRLSPGVLIEWLAFTNREVRDYFAGLDPDGPAGFPVAWAGQNVSPVWLDVAREFTEKWHHQQQIRDAVSHPGLKEAHYLRPLLATFARALPRSYSRVAAEIGTSVEVVIPDEGASHWILMYESEGWKLYGGPVSGTPAARIQTSSETAWRLFTKGIAADEAKKQAQTHGPSDLTDPFFESLAIMG